MWAPVADLLAAELAGHRGFAIDCAGDLRCGGPKRAINVATPFGGDALHTFELADRAVATMQARPRIIQGAAAAREDEAAMHDRGLGIVEHPPQPRHERFQGRPHAGDEGLRFGAGRQRGVRAPSL